MNNTRKLIIVPIEKLERGKFQPRRSFNEETLKELAASIRTQGIIEPLIIHQKNDANTYEIIAGERRWRAAMIAGLSEVPCLIGEYSEEQIAAISLIENIQRQDLSPLEEANGYQKLLDAFNFTQHEIATLVGKSRSYIANLLRIQTLCRAVQELMRQQHLSLGHARVLVGLTPQLQLKFARHVIKNQWSVRKLETEVQKNKSDLPTVIKHPDLSDIEYLQDKLIEYLGAPVQIISEGKGGWLKIKYYNNDTLKGLLDRFGLSYD